MTIGGVDHSNRTTSSDEELASKTLSSVDERTTKVQKRKSKKKKVRKSSGKLEASVKSKSSIDALKEVEVAQKVLFDRTADYSKNPEILDLCHFIAHSPTAWHAVENMKAEYVKAGFQELDLKNPVWGVELGGKYFVTQNGSTFLAFVLPRQKPKSFAVVGAHTDSPALRTKPNPEKSSSGVNLLCPEYYGGPTLPTWFDRDLGLAGRVNVIDIDGKAKCHIYDSERAVAFLSTVPIHLKHEQLTKLEINEQRNLPVITTLTGTHDRPFIEELLSEKIDFKKIIGTELFLYPVQEPRIINGQFLSSWRLDNLLGTHAGYRGLLQNAEPEEDRAKIFISWDNEEVGSKTAQGAASMLLEEVISRACLDLELSYSELSAAKNASGLISVDSSHAEHPNYKELYEPDNTAYMGDGPVIKVNAQQHYSTDAISQGWIHEVALKEGIPVKEFCARTDGRCGSTIGSIVASKLGIRGVDIGVAQLAMHSAREHFALVDHLHMIVLLRELYSHSFDVEYN